MNYAIIAAGRGSRLRNGGESMPKPLVELDGEPMIARLVKLLDRHGASKISVIVNEEMPEVAQCLRQTSTQAPLSLKVKSTSGSMESFSELASEINADEPFCLLTVDTVFQEEEFARFIDDFSADNAFDGYMAVSEHIDDERPLYVGVNSEGEITGFLDNPYEGIRYVSGGIYALRPGALDILDDCRRAGKKRMRDYQRALIAAGLRLKARCFSKIIDVDNPSDLQEARQLVADAGPSDK